MLTLLANTIRQAVVTLRAIMSVVSWFGWVIYTAASMVVLSMATAVDGLVTFLRILYEDNESILWHELAAALDDRSTAAKEMFEGALRTAGSVLAGAVTKTLEAAWWLATFAPRQGPVLVRLVRSLAPELTGVMLLWVFWRAGRLARTRGYLRALWWRLRLLGDADLRWVWRTEREDRPDGARLISEERGVTSACVVCRERVKSVLTLPCRHVCLCRECCNTIYAYQRQCPICRTFIYHTVNVYM